MGNFLTHIPFTREDKQEFALACLANDTQTFRLHVCERLPKNLLDEDFKQKADLVG